MILYPAIDLKAGRCVRLVRGDMDQATVFAEAPETQAMAFEAAGFRWIHVVDLDGAVEGGARNAEAAARIMAAVSIPVQIGGGVRSMAQIDAWLAAGAARVILGTVAVRDPELVRNAARAHPGKIAIAIDTREGRVAVAGWVEQTEISASDLAKRFEDAGAACLIVTDIGRDGLKTGVNVGLTAELAAAVETPVIASGGLRSVDDIRALKAAPGRAIAGAILGRALYDGDVIPAEALAAAA